MMAVEMVGADGRTPDPGRTGSVSAHCHSQGVLTLTAGTYGNVLRFLPPLVMPPHLLEEAFDVLDEAFDATG
jgi:4-aminobutyrate aminotransferase/(S)-3-amino-2-methylpropionate transaminase